MNAPAGFEPVAEVTADERARIVFGRAGVREDEELRASLLRGLGDVTQGRITRRDELLDGDDKE